MTTQIERQFQEIRKEFEHLREGDGDLRARLAVVEKLASVAWQQSVDMEKRLIDKMTEGFGQVIARQDIAANNIANHDRDILNLKLWRAFLSGGVGALGFLVAVFGVYLLARFA